MKQQNNSSNDLQKALAQGIQNNMTQNNYNQPNLYSNNLNQVTYNQMNQPVQPTNYNNYNPPQYNNNNYNYDNYNNYNDTSYNKNIDPPIAVNDNYKNLQIEDKINKAEDPLGHLDNSLAGSARKQFIMKVYLILTGQLLLTAGMCFLSYFIQPFLRFQYDNYWLMWVCTSIILIVQITIFCCPAGRKHPVNLVLLLIFTICQGYLISYICAIVAIDNGGSQVVIVAAVMTFAITLGLTVYAIFTKEDFQTKWGILIVLLVAMLMLAIFSIFAWSPFLNNLYCALGVIVFGIYLVIDTQLIIGGRSLQLSMDDYVAGALILYIDIIQIFLYLLSLLSKK